MLLIGAGILALLLCVYFIVKSKSDLLVRLAVVIPFLAAPLLLLARQSIRIGVAGIVIGLGIGLYCAELLSAVLIDPDRPALQAMEKVARSTGVRFDGHTLLEEINEHRRDGTPAYPPFYPYHLLDAPLKIDGVPVVPLASISHILTICCNEGGQYLSYSTDDHGFPNPPDAWRTQEPADIVFVGASAAVGEAVPAADNLLSQLRTRYKRTYTLGAGGNGPLLELASMREYLQVFRPKQVLWMFSESHSPEYLEEESQSTLLQHYLKDPTFSQDLLSKQPLIDQAIRQYFEAGMQTEAVQESWKTKVKGLVELKNIRTALYYFVTARKAPKPHILDPHLYEQVLTEGRRMVESWDGRVTIVYFPDSSRYAGICNYSPQLRQLYDRTHDTVMKSASKLGIPVIDLATAFPDVPAAESAVNTPYFYPYPAHYTPVGYHRAGKAILDALENTK